MEQYKLPFNPRDMLAAFLVYSYGRYVQPPTKEVAKAMGITTHAVRGMASRVRTTPSAASVLIALLEHHGIPTVKLAEDLGEYFNKYRRGLENPETWRALAEFDALMDVGEYAWNEALSTPAATSSTNITSRLVDGDGHTILEWHKPNTVSLNDVVEAIIDGVKEGVKATPKSKQVNYARAVGDSVAVLPLADLHFGVEGISPAMQFQQYITACRYLLNNVEPNSVLVLANLGDLLHMDNLAARTPKSGKVLTTGSDYAEAVKWAIQFMVTLIEAAREKSSEVIVVSLSGNHDEATGVVIQEALGVMYDNIQGVYVRDTLGERRHYEQIGSVMLGFTHGDTTKDSQLPLLMATERPLMWGKSAHRVFHRGHYHTKGQNSFNGVLVEAHGTPAAPDRWHREQGYTGGSRTMSLIHYTSKEGEWLRHQVKI